MLDEIVHKSMDVHFVNRENGFDFWYDNGTQCPEAFAIWLFMKRSRTDEKLLYIETLLSCLSLLWMMRQKRLNLA